MGLIATTIGADHEETSTPKEAESTAAAVRHLITLMTAIREQEAKINLERVNPNLKCMAVKAIMVAADTEATEALVGTAGAEEADVTIAKMVGVTEIAAANVTAAVTEVVLAVADSVAVLRFQL